jgi:hypothetical protein
VTGAPGGIAFDVADIGAKPRRVMSAHIVEERAR